ncbi:DUF3221 domain-containing protein [Paenibacillus tundrae]|uniref:Uncharacterized protein YcfL n=1 Tax=Paenibacillus tundrae TaxID=528187 RepID=A0ABT9WK05_9BACL|nr:DUF3221 domain-containing protein [Paenibacillus tundrae]MDQ0173586.1 uncharacterized protein YcfL [Paenibacillus tundrae]
MRRTLSLISVVVLLSYVLVGCGTAPDHENMNTNNEPIQNEVKAKEDFEAVILAKDQSTITIAVTTSDHAEQQYILVTSGINYHAEVGDEVRVWTTGMYEESNPIQGVATKVERVK